MKYLKIIVLFLLVIVANSCSNDSSPDCFKNAGATISYEVPMAGFMNISVSEGIELVITEGPIAKVIVETGENLKADITTEVIGNELYLRNSSSCNWVRDYNTTKIYVTTPQLEKIYSASQFSVRSQGVLNYPLLRLQSGLVGETSSGTFDLALNAETLIIEDNQSSYFKISGTVTNLQVNFYSGDARFDGSALSADKVTVFHRSSNDIIVHPVQECSGTLYSTGNLVLKNQPPILNVERLYTGTVVFQ